MAEIVITAPGGERLAMKLSALSSGMVPNLSRGMEKAGDLLLRSIRDKIKGEGFTRNPARSSPYPGILSGQMFRTSFKKVDSSPAGPALRVGPNVGYAQYQEYGTKDIPARPFVGPTLEEEGDKALGMIVDEAMRPLYR